MGMGLVKEVRADSSFTHLTEERNEEGSVRPAIGVREGCFSLLLYDCFSLSRIFLGMFNCWGRTQYMGKYSRHRKETR